MSTPFIAEIKIFTSDFAPTGYAFCDGQLLSRTQNGALFSILGLNYGSGPSTFALPDLRARSPIGNGAGPGLTPQDLGDVTGSAGVTLLQTEIPSHTHTLQALQNRAALNAPSGALLAVNPNQFPFAPAAAGVSLPASAIAAAGGSAPHNNLQPYLVLNFIIALTGTFPPRP